MANELKLKQIIGQVMRDHIGPEDNRAIGEGGVPRIDWYALQAELLSALSVYSSRPAPAATDTGLVTVLPLGWRKYRNGDAEAVTPFGEIYTAYVNGYWRVTRNGKAGKFIKATGGDDVEAAKSGAQADFDTNVLSLVRSQAEELLVAKDYLLSVSDTVAQQLQNQIVTLTLQKEDLEADNVAKDARVKELETERTMIVSHATMGEMDGIGLTVNDISVRVTALRNKLYDEGKKQSEALEAKLTAAEKALDGIAGYTDTPSGEWREKHPELAEAISKPGVVHHSHVIQEVCKFSRAVLGGKPS